jgi:hypothetical protein
MLAAGGWPVRLLLAVTRPRYRRLERQASGEFTGSGKEEPMTRTGPVTSSVAQTAGHRGPGKEEPWR